ncbi:MAG: DUF1207 domain-containing protein [Bacteroidota bacterium]
MKKILPILLLFFHVYGAKAQSADSTKLTWTLLPETHLVPLFTADSRAHRLSIQKPFSDNGYIGSMGGIFPVFSVANSKKIFQVSAASTVYTTLRRWTDRGRLINVDFFVDIYGDLKLTEQWAIRSGIGHTSQHLSDDAVVDEGKMPINYTRDYGQLFGVYHHAGYAFRAYAGLIFNTNFKTTSSLGPILIPQIGMEHSPVKWKTHHYLYYAFDIKFRGELDYRTMQNYQIGYKYSVPYKHTFRFAINYSHGLDERGQFYTQTRNFGTIGVFFDF